MKRPARPSGPGVGLSVGLVLAVAIGVGLLGVPKADRALAWQLTWATNPVPCVALGLGLLGLWGFAHMVVRRRLRWITDEHRTAARQRRDARRALPKALRRQLAIPPVVAFVLFALPYALVWATGVLTFSWGSALGPETRAPVWVRVLADALSGPGHALSLLGPVLGWGAVVEGAWGRFADAWLAMWIGTPTPTRRRLPDPGPYQGQRSRWWGPGSWRDDPVFVLGARETPGARQLEPHCPMRSWVFHQGKPVFGGLLVFGEKGSGKTSLLTRIIADALAYRPEDDGHKPSLMALDPKGDLSAFIEQQAARVGRFQDVVRLRVGGPTTWNPLGHLGPTSTGRQLRQAGYFLSCALPASSGESASYWEGNAKQLLSYCVTLLAWAGDTVSFASLARLTVRLNATSDDDQRFRQDLYDRARDTLHAHGSDPARLYDLQQAIAYFDHEFVRIPPKPRGIIINTVNTFLRQFEGHEYHASFCGPGTEPGHFKGFEWLVDHGGIFVLDLRSSEDGQVQPALCCLAKLFFQAAVKTRDRRDPNRGSNGDPKRARVVVNVMDEYQQYVTVRPEGEDDPSFFETSRSFRCIDVVATQQPSSVAAALKGQRDQAQRVVGSFNSLVFFRVTDPMAQQLIQTMLGNREVVEVSSSVQEGSHDVSRRQGGDVDPQSVNRSVSTRMAHRPRVSPEDIASLQTFEAIGIFSAPTGRHAVRFCAKPHFVPLRTSQLEVLRLITQDA